jgi:hypothetical protein
VSKRIQKPVRRLRDRQPERKDRRKRGGRHRLSGYDAGKKIKGNIRGGISRRYPGPSDARPGACGRYPGSRRRDLGPGQHVWALPFWRSSSPTAAIRGHSSAAHWRSSCRSSRAKSSRDPTASKASRSCQDAGSWSGRLLGSTAADDWPRFSRTRTVTFSYHPASVDQADAAKAEQFPMILFGRTLTPHAFAANGRRVRSFPKAGRTLIKAATPASTG